jgi:tripartite-type tricarboxylate transporter receptor subunit TctC
MLVANVPNIVVVNPASGITSIPALIAAARARPGAIHFGSAGIGASTHLAGELFKLMAGANIVHVPYRGSVPALRDLRAGQVQLMFENMPGAIELARAGRLTALAVTSPSRAAAAPDIPTVAEAGLPGYAVVSWFAIFAPGATPAPVVRRPTKASGASWRGRRCASASASLAPSRRMARPRRSASWRARRRSAGAA